MKRIKIFRHMIFDMVFLLALIFSSCAYARSKVLIVPIENGGHANSFEQLSSYNTVLFKEILNSGLLYPVQAKETSLALISVKPRANKFKGQTNTGKRSFVASQTQQVAKQNGVDFLLHSNVLSYDGFTVNERSRNIKADYPTVSGTIGVSLISPIDGNVIWYYESSSKVNTSYYALSNGLQGGRKDLDNNLYYALVEKICKDVVKRMQKELKEK